MKKIFNAICLTALLATVSCSEYLEQSPTDRYTDDQVWQDDFLIESHLAELYALSVFMVNDALATYGTSPGNIDYNQGSGWDTNIGVSAQGEGPVHSTTIADEGKYSECGAQTNYHGMKLYGVQRNSSYMRWWSNGYYLNRQLNHFIESMETSTLATKELRTAEARFLRAFNYFAMVKRYGGVPLITKETQLDADESEIYPARNTEKECWDFIINECLEIAEVLEPNPESARASKWAALALAGRAALYAGSIAQWGTVQLDGLVGIDADPKDYYETAIKACEEIMTKSGHGLYKGSMSKGYVANLEDVFLQKNNTEVLLCKHHQGQAETVNLWSWDICIAPKPNAWGVGQYVLPYYDFVENFDFIDGRSGVIDHETLSSRSWTMDELWGDRDPRIRAWMWTNGYKWNGASGFPFADGTVSMYLGIRLPDGTKFYNITDKNYVDGDLTVQCYGDQMSRMATASLYTTGFGVAKNLDPNADVMTWFVHSTTDYVIFRYAEVLLNYAEACFEVGRTGDALNAVNQIRSRAGVAELGGITRDAIRKERHCELCFENHRYWDLRRWRIATDVLSKPHWGLTYVLDWETYKNNHDEKGNFTTEPRFWLEFEDHIDSKVQDPTFPESNYYLPIGDGTIAVNPNLVENPGY